MSFRNNSPTDGCIFQWRIENLSNCYWLEEEVRLVSPTFTADAFNGTKWSLHLYPMGYEFDDDVSFFLHRENDDGPNVIEVNYHLAFLSKEGTFLKGFYNKHGFERGDVHGRCNFESRQRIFFTDKKEFLPGDVLTVQCTLRKTYDTFVNFKHIYARSVSKVNRNSVLWKIDKFSAVEPGCLRNKFKDNLIDMDLIFNKNAFETDVILCDESIKYISVDISIIDSQGKKINCADWESNGYKTQGSIFGGMLVEYGIFGGISYVISRFPYRWMKNKSKYLPNDVLSLSIEFVYATITNSYEFFDSVTIPPQLTKEVVKKGNEHYIEKEKSQNPSVLIDDLKSMYTDEIFSDTKLHSSSQIFSVHRSILSARSPVFSRMFSHDMKEKNSGHVYITDLENDTVHRMLLFIYADFLGDLQFESASKLYMAADKYEILSLRSRCSSFLKDNVCPTNACDVLMLADSHHDEDLKSFVQAYILEHDEVFSLQEWKNLMKNDPKLAADIMYKKIHPCNA